MKPFNLNISPLAMDTTQRYLKTHNHYETQNTSLKLICMTLFILTCFNSLFSGLMVYKNAMIVQENVQLIKENRQILDFLQVMIPMHKMNETFPQESERFARMQECPPCTTEKPTIIEPYKNPVSILNEMTHYAVYECSHQCRNPPIHLAVIRVEQTPHMEGKEFVGKGESKQKSKQAAAYRALEFGYPGSIDEIAEEHIPDLSYSPICINPFTLYTQSKC